MNYQFEETPNDDNESSLEDDLYRNCPLQIPSNRIAKYEELFCHNETKSNKQNEKHDKVIEHLRLCKLGESDTWRKVQREIQNEESGITFRPKVKL